MNDQILDSNIQLNSLNDLIASNANQMDIISTLFSFCICVLVSFIVRDCYIKNFFLDG
jgi:hypothetical protein